LNLRPLGPQVDAKTLDFKPFFEGEKPEVIKKVIRHMFD
jgi:hypothetical protein